MFNITTNVYMGRRRHFFAWPRDRLEFFSGVVWPRRERLFMGLVNGNRDEEGYIHRTSTPFPPTLYTRSTTLNQQRAALVSPTVKMDHVLPATRVGPMSILTEYIYIRINIIMPTMRIAGPNNMRLIRRNVYEANWL